MAGRRLRIFLWLGAIYVAGSTVVHVAYPSGPVADYGPPALAIELARDQDMVPGLLNIGDANRPSSAWKYHAAHRVGCTGVDALGKLPGAGVEIDLTLDHVRGILGQGCFGHTSDRAKAKDVFVDPAEITGHRHRHADDNHHTDGARHLEKVSPIDCFHTPS